MTAESLEELLQFVRHRKTMSLPAEVEAIDFLELLKRPDLTALNHYVKTRLGDTCPVFVEVVVNAIVAQIDVLSQAGQDYGKAEDRLANFNAAARAIGITPRQALYVYAYKHWSAFEAWSRNAMTKREPLSGRACDVSNYLLLAILMERLEKNGEKT